LPEEVRTVKTKGAAPVATPFLFDYGNPFILLCCCCEFPQQDDMLSSDCNTYTIYYGRKLFQVSQTAQKIFKALLS
jgi:hypothetical protein